MFATSTLYFDSPLIIQVPTYTPVLPTFLTYQEPTLPSVLKNQKRKRNTRNGQQDGKGKWTKREQEAYLQYIESNHEKMSSKVIRKSQKVFLMMSYLVETRSADQCRSHHQKMLKYHENISQILQRYRKIVNFGEEGRQMDDYKKMERKTRVEEPIISSNLLFTIERNQNYFRVSIMEELVPALEF